MILVVGGAGYIGAHVCKMLSERGNSLIVLDNLSNGHKSFAKWGELIEGDMGDKDILRFIFKKYPVKAVMHFAAFAYVGESVEYPRKYYDNNFVNSLTLINAMCDHNVKYIIFSSTCSTYGNPEAIPINENHKQNPINPYGASKCMIERILQDYDRSYGLKSVIFRYFNAAGADEQADIGERHNPETHLIPLVLEAAAGRRDFIEIYGDDYETYDGTCIRDYIHVHDIAEAHILGLEYLDRTNQSAIFNLGNEMGFSIREVIKTAERVTGRSIESHVGQRRDGDPALLVGSSKKAKELLCWNPKLNSLEKIIGTAWNWHKHDWKL